MKFSNRIQQVPPSFLREIFKVIADDRIISFAGGLPNPNLFPIEAFKRATEATLTEAPHEALQYGSTDGLLELRTIIADSYKTKDELDISPEQIILTNGSQQGLDLIGKVLINPTDTVAVESPTYLAAIQALSVYEPAFAGITLQSDGLDTEELSEVLTTNTPKLLYTIPNFQNPTGITYSNEKRQEIATLLKDTEVVLVEDDPYGEVRFAGERRKPFAKYLDTTILLGSFSKILAPGLRLGWIVAKDDTLRERLQVAKQAADLHTSTFTQHVVYRYYRDNDMDAHVTEIAEQYRDQKNTMLDALHEHFNDGVTFTNPEGGMFIWATFPDEVDTSDLFEHAIDAGVAFVPGESFFSGNGVGTNTMRLNYTNASPENIKEGVARLARAYEAYKVS